MDPASAFSIATGASQCIQQTAKVIAWLLKYLAGVKQAPKLAKELRMELFSIHQVLEELKSTCEGLSSGIKADALSETVSEFLNTMAEVEKNLDIKENEINWKRFKWPLTQKDTEKYISKLERHKSTFSLALGIIQRFESYPVYSGLLMFQQTITTHVRQFAGHSGLKSGFDLVSLLFS